MKRMLLAVIDTNVIVSSLLSSNPDSATVRLIEEVFNGKLKPVFNEEILSEYTGVLLRPKFGFKPELVHSFLESFSEMGIDMDRTPYLGDMPDPKDRVFYEVALTGNSYLVTGNQKHFPCTPIVVTPAQMLNILYKSEA